MGICGLTIYAFTYLDLFVPQIRLQSTSDRDKNCFIVLYCIVVIIGTTGYVGLLQHTQQTHNM